MQSERSDLQRAAFYVIDAATVLQRLQRHGRGGPTLPDIIADLERAEKALAAILATLAPWD